MSINFYKKIIIGTVLFGLIANPAVLSPFQIKKAEAVWGVGDIVYDPTIHTFLVGQETKRTTETVLVTIKKIAGMLLKKLIIDRLVDKSVEWIQKGGFEGKSGPFIEDWDAFFQQAGEDFVGELANTYVPMLCGPFQANVAISLLAPQKFSKSVECSLNKITENIDNFFQDFRKESKGRWIAYNTLWEPENNFYGAVLGMEDQRQTKLADILNKQNVKATVNLGFKPQVECKTDSETGKEICKTVTPGKIIGDSVQQAVLPNFKQNAILSADDIASYVGALLDAVIYRYGLMAIGGAKKALGYMDSDNPDKTYEKYAEETFKGIDKTSFENKKALYLDEIAKTLKIKRDTMSAFEQSSTTLQDLIKNLTIAAECKAEGLTEDQSVKIGEAKLAIPEINDSIFNIGIKKDDLQEELDGLESAYEELAALDSEESDEIELFSIYNNFKITGKLDIDKATDAWNDARTELESIKEEYSIALNNDSNNPLSGYKDIIEICK